MTTEQPERVEHADAINYVLRTAQQNTLHLSAMADQKASVVLGASFVMASIVFSDVAGDTDPALASILLAVTAVVSGLFAALAVMPRGVSSKNSDGSTNVLFFGHVATMDHDEYFDRMQDVLESGPTIYGAILEDLYQASQVLMFRKYRLLRYSYVALTVGMVATLIAVLIDA
ncbi:MAG: Pycsar system effector family protein [Actinomycetota bacterium]